MAICRVVSKALYNFKIKRAQEARYNQFFFQNVQNNEVFEIFKMFKTNIWINIYYTKSKGLWSLDCWFCFQLENFFRGVNLVQEFKIISLNWNFALKTSSNMLNSRVMFTFLFSTGNTFFGKFGPNNQNCQFERKICTRLISISRIM